MQIKLSTGDDKALEILKIFKTDINTHYKPTSQYVEQQSPDYGRYVPYGYRTLDIIAYLLAGEDACSTACLHGRNSGLRIITKI